MLQVPSNNGLSLPPSQTPTLVGRTSLNMAVEASNSSSDIRWEPTEPTQPLEPLEAESTSPKVSLSFLLLSGKRKSWEFEQTDSFAEVKSRVCNEWPSEWIDEIKPQSAAAIRLLHLGRLLPDEESLSNNPRFPARPAPSTVVHLSVRPFPARGASTTGSLKQKTTGLRTGSAFTFTGRGNASNSPTATRPGDPNSNQPIDSSQESHSSGCGCIIC